MYLEKENSNNKRSYLTLLKNKNYFLYLVGMLISRFGDSIDFIAYGLMVLNITGSASLMALLYAFNCIPNIVFQPFAGVFVNYKNKRNVLFVCNFGRAIVVTLTTVMYFTNIIHTYHLFIFTFINSTFESFQSPASSSALTLILDKEDYSYGLSLNSTLSNIIQLIGYGVATGIIGFIGISGGMFIDASSFYICGVLMFIIKYKTEKTQKQFEDIKRFFSDFRDGLSYIKNSKVVLISCILAVLFNMLVVPLDSLNVPYITNDLKLGSYGISLFGFAISFGSIIGSFTFPKLKEKFKCFSILILSGLLFGISYSVLYIIKFISFNYALYLFLFIFSFLLGTFSSLISMLVNVAFYENIESEYISRCSGVCNSLCMASMPLSSVIIAFISSVICISKLYLFLGLFTIILFILEIQNKTLKKL